MTRLGRTFTIAALCVLASAATAHASSARGCCGQRRELEVGPKASACANVLIAHVEPGLSMVKSS